MYTKDKSNRITLRLNDAQFDFVRDSAQMLGISPSDFVRMVINMTMYGTQATANSMVKEGQRRENEQANFNDIV